LKKDYFCFNKETTEKLREYLYETTLEATFLSNSNYPAKWLLISLLKNIKKIEKDSSEDKIENLKVF